MWNVGISLIRAIQVAEVCRDAAHMLAFGIDFSQTANQTMLQYIAQGLNLTSTGSSVVILSVVTYVPSTCSCTNASQYVLTKRIIIGNASVISSTAPSAFGNPTSTDMDSTGSIAPATYMSDASCVAAGFSTLMPVTGGVPALTVGQYAYMSEMTLSSSDLSGKNLRSDSLERSLQSGRRAVLVHASWLARIIAGSARIVCQSFKERAVNNFIGRIAQADRIYRCLYAGTVTRGSRSDCVCHIVRIAQSGVIDGLYGIHPKIA